MCISYIIRYFHQCLITDTFLDVYNFDGISSEQLELVVDYMYRQISWQQLVADNVALSLVSTLEIYNYELGRRESGVGEGGEGGGDLKAEDQQDGTTNFRRIVKAPRVCTVLFICDIR